MLIGIPKEIMHKENRVAALPETVEKFKTLGFNVIVETKAGIGVFAVDFNPPSELVIGEGGYAKALPEEWLEKERQELAPIVADSDIVVLSALVPGEVAQTLVTKEMVETMKPGSVIIDVSIDQGGNCEMTDPGKELMHKGVYICGIKNIPGSLPVHSSWLYANNLYYFVENLFKNGADQFDMTDEIIKEALVTYKGKLYHEGMLKAMDQNNH